MDLPTRPGLLPGTRRGTNAQGGSVLPLHAKVASDATGWRHFLTAVLVSGFLAP